MLRAYDKATGKEVGAVFMPAPQSGSPMTYMANGRQYIVVAVSGGPYSGEYIAFALPERCEMNRTLAIWRRRGALGAVVMLGAQETRSRLGRRLHRSAGQARRGTLFRALRPLSRRRRYMGGTDGAGR